MPWIILSDEPESDDSRDSKSKKFVYIAFPATVDNFIGASGFGTMKDGEICDDS